MPQPRHAEGIYQAFDEAWESIVGHYGDDPFCNSSRAVKPQLVNPAVGHAEAPTPSI